MNALARLPTELLLQIIHDLDYLTRTRLKSTNRYFNITVNAEECDEQDKMSAVLLAQDFPQNDDAFGCFRCYKVLPASAFDDRLIGRNYPVPIRLNHVPAAHHRKGGWRELWRYCLDCGFRLQLHEPGEVIYVRGVRMVICSCCMKLNESACPNCNMCRD